MKIVPPNLFHQFLRKNYKRNSKQWFKKKFKTVVCLGILYPILYRFWNGHLLLRDTSTFLYKNFLTELAITLGHLAKLKFNSVDKFNNKMFHINLQNFLISIYLFPSHLFMFIVLFYLSINVLTLNKNWYWKFTGKKKIYISKFLNITISQKVVVARRRTGWG